MELKEKIIDYALFAYQKGATFKEIGDKLKISEANVYKIIRQYGTQEINKKHNNAIIERQIKRSNNRNITGEDILTALKNGMTLNGFIDESNIPFKVVEAKLKEYAEKSGMKIEDIVPNYNYKPVNPRGKDIPMDRVIEEWVSNGDMSKLAKELGVEVNTLYWRIRKSGIKFERSRRRTNYARKDIPINKIMEAAAEGKTYKDIAKEYGISISTVSRYIAEYEKQTGTKVKKTGQKNLQEDCVSNKTEIVKKDKVIEKQTASTSDTNTIEELRKRIPTVPMLRYLTLRSQGLSERETLNTLILEQEKATKQTMTVDIER